MLRAGPRAANLAGGDEKTVHVGKAGARDNPLDGDVAVGGLGREPLAQPPFLVGVRGEGSHAALGRARHVGAAVVHEEDLAQAGPRAHTRHGRARLDGHTGPQRHDVGGIDGREA